MTASMKYLIFQLRNQLYGMEIKHIISIEPYQLLTELPQSSSFIKGITKIRDVTTPIIDLKERLLLPQSERTDETKILVIHIKGMQIGFIIDAALEVKDIDTKLIEEAPKLVGGISETYMKGVAKLETGLLILLEIEALINIDEKEELKKLVTE